MRHRKDTDELAYRRLVAEEELILEATETIVMLLEEQGLSRQELAKRLGKSKSFITQILSGDRNMTLRTLADAGDALGHRFRLVPQPSDAELAPASAAHGGSQPAGQRVAALRKTATSQRRAACIPQPRLAPEGVQRFVRAAESQVAADSHEYALAS